MVNENAVVEQAELLGDGAQKKVSLWFGFSAPPDLADKFEKVRVGMNMGMTRSKMLRQAVEAYLYLWKHRGKQVKVTWIGTVLVLNVVKEEGEKAGEATQCK